MRNPDVRPVELPGVGELVAALVAIDSVNPSLVRGAAGEAGIARFVAGWLERAGLEVSSHEVAPGRWNVIAVARGRGGGRTLLLNAHTDTVGARGMDGAHEPRLEGGRLFGRGAYDTKGGLAAAMVAIAAVRDLAGDVVLAAVADEEAGGLGTRAVIAERRADAAIVIEPTELQVAVAHKGFAGFELVTRGRAAHGSRPERGVDAIAAMGPILVELAALAEELRRREPHPLLGTGSVHASQIEGGQEFSSYPERCRLTGERRTLPGESAADIELELRRLVERSGVEAELRLLFAGDAFEAAVDEEIVALVHRHAGTALVGVPYWADSALLARAGIPTVLIGPAGGGEHSNREWVDLPSVERLAEILVAVAADFCGDAGRPVTTRTGDTGSGRGLGH
jgi:acetylornithine deacetylase